MLHDNHTDVAVFQIVNAPMGPGHVSGTGRGVDGALGGHVSQGAPLDHSRGAPIFMGTPRTRIGPPGAVSPGGAIRIKQYFME